MHNIDKRYENGDIEEKQAIISLMFPEFLEFDETTRQTQGIIPAIMLIYQNPSELQDKKMGQIYLFRLVPRCDPAGTRTLDLLIKSQ